MDENLRIIFEYREKYPTVFIRCEKCEDGLHFTAYSHEKFDKIHHSFMHIFTKKEVHNNTFKDLEKEFVCMVKSAIPEMHSNILKIDGENNDE